MRITHQSTEVTRQKHKEYMRKWLEIPENKKKQAEYIKIWQRKKYQEMRFLLNEYKKTIKCNVCGISGHPAIIDFHHKDGQGDKDESVSRMISGRSDWNKVLEEINKCVPMCSNCHRILHFENKNPENAI